MEDKNKDNQAKDDAAKPPTGEQLILQGPYMNLPLTVAALTNISASAKLVWGILHWHMGKFASSAYPSMSTIARETGLSVRTAIRATQELSDAGLAGIDKDFGAVNYYNLYAPKPTERPRKKNKNQCQNVTSDKMALVTKRHGGSDKMAQDQCQNVTLIQTPGIQIPPNPPTGGGACVASQGEEGKESDRSAIAHALDVAHEAVFGTPMPSRWRRRLERMDGEIGVFVGVTAADVRAAMVRAKDQRRTFGLGWVENVCRDKAAASKTASDRVIAAGDRQRVEATELERQKAEQAARDAHHAEAARAYWQSLTPTHQEVYRQSARSRRLMAKAPAEQVEAMAVQLAYRDSLSLAAASQSQ